MKEMIYDPENRKVVLLDSGKYKDFSYYIVSHYGEYPLAYIKIPDGLKIDCENYEDYESNNHIVSPHGGFTYGCENDIPPMLDGIDGITSGNYLGWDYAHCGDYIGFFNDEALFGKKWTTKEILEQIKNTIEEIML